MIPSHGRTPEWFATMSAGPRSGTCSTPEDSTRHHIVYRNSKKGRMVWANFGSYPNSSTSSECHAK